MSTKNKKKTKKAKKAPTRNFASVDAIVKFEAAWAAKQAELVHKHNELAAQTAAIEGMFKQLVSSIATELGKLQGTLENHMQALSGLDLNILASAEVLKELTAQVLVCKRTLLMNDSILAQPGEAVVKQEAEDWFKQMVASAFQTVRQKLELEAQQQREAMQKAKEEAEKQTEAQRVEQELKNAEEVERTVVSANSGGPGSDFPQGAEIFGG